jgi:hypothetical protein
MMIYFSRYYKRNILLYRIRNTINKSFGFKSKIPRVNLGPCGSFAKIFYFAWNERFKEKVNIGFLFSADKQICFHCFIKLPDGKYFDGGNGVQTRNQLLKKYPQGSIIEEMTEYDEQMLEKYSEGTNKKYHSCENYDATIVKNAVEYYLDQL